MNSKTVSINTHRGDGDPQMPRSKTFVTMVSNEPWLLHATTGQGKCYADSFGRTTLLDILRERVSRASNGEVEQSSSGEPSIVSGDADTDEYDPMEAIAPTPCTPCN